MRNFKFLRANKAFKCAVFSPTFEDFQLFMFGYHYRSRTPLSQCVNRYHQIGDIVFVWIGKPEDIHGHEFAQYFFYNFPISELTWGRTVRDFLINTQSASAFTDFW